MLQQEVFVPQDPGSPEEEEIKEKKPTSQGKSSSKKETSKRDGKEKKDRGATRVRGLVRWGWRCALLKTRQSLPLTARALLQMQKPRAVEQWLSCNPSTSSSFTLPSSPCSVLGSVYTVLCFFSRGCHFVFFIHFLFDHSFSMSTIFLNYYLGASLVKMVHW